MKELPPAITRALVALSCDDAEFGELFADEVGEDGQQQLFTRTDYMVAVWIALADLADLVELATLPASSIACIDRPRVGSRIRAPATAAA
ncbi:MAG: hypothetical protein MZV65_42045 [Chromatiales bacterium]|nr:hypothetical protein [Chromatiales bacterium]